MRLRVSKASGPASQSPRYGHQQPQRSGKPSSPSHKGRFGSRRPPPSRGPPKKVKQVTADQLRVVLINRLPVWATSARATQKLCELGFGAKEAKSCLQAFSSVAVRSLKGKERASEEDMSDWDVVSLKIALGMDLDSANAVERVLLRRALEWAVTTGDEQGLVGHALAIRLSDILEATDLRDLPQDFPAARQIQRHFHMHIGPTNSGKTYNALKALTAARTGAYAGPLRLLAHEVWERINLGTVGSLVEGQGRECNLLTGEEQRTVSQSASLTSCTVEMLPLGAELDVVVIDEIQMIADEARGAAWTTAILGLCAKEIHLCGEETVVEVVSKLVEDMGDKITIHRYERLTPLNVAEKSLEGDLGKIEAGDCIVSFSRSGIFATKKLIEQKTGKRCAVVYGALPPETRSEQAKLFNEEGNGVDIMVASDAVGMGLNLCVCWNMPHAAGLNRSIPGKSSEWSLKLCTSTTACQRSPSLYRKSSKSPAEPAASVCMDHLLVALSPLSTKKTFPFSKPSSLVRSRSFPRLPWTWTSQESKDSACYLARTCPSPTSCEPMRS